MKRVISTKPNHDEDESHDDYDHDFDDDYAHDFDHDDGDYLGDRDDDYDDGIRGASTPVKMIMMSTLMA